MATELCVEGPFEISYSGSAKSKRINRDGAREFWNDPAKDYLRKKKGCYIFALRAGRGATPYYVGKASKGFKQEVMTSHKIVHYNDALHERGGGTPVMYFVCPLGNKNKVATTDLNHMEKDLIQYAHSKNPNLTNVQNTKNLPEWSIRGVIRSSKGKPSAAAAGFRTMMGI